MKTFAALLLLALSDAAADFKARCKLSLADPEFKAVAKEIKIVWLK